MTQLDPADQNERWLRAEIPELQAAMAAGRLTARQLVLACLDLIARYDKSGPCINSVLEVNPDALHLADALDAERLRTGPRGPLHGIPVLVKDNIDSADKMHTSAGSLALAGSYALKDAFVVSQLRKAGAIILGKTNMTEWANFMTRKMPNGYSSRGGQVRNPYGPGKFDVGGSSSGSGAAVAAHFATVAVGTETSGSILSPASANSIVGIKPTVGLISRSGIIPIAHSQDTAGPMARTVTDAAILLGALAGVDESDPATLAGQWRTLKDYTKFLTTDGLQGARIGIPREVYFDGLSNSQSGLMDEALAALKSAGAVIVDPVAIPSAQENWDIQVLLYEFKSDLNAYLSRLSPNVQVHSLTEVIAFNNLHKETALGFGQILLEESEQTSGTLTEPAYLASRMRDLRLSQAEGIDYAMGKHGLDALLFPANFGAGIAAKAGYPSITVPGGYTQDGEPLGVTFTAQAFSEPTLIKLAYAFEQATKHRVEPQFT